MGTPAPARRFFRPTWVEVDLAALVRNLRAFRGRMPRGTKLMFVVKGNAYGHGAAACSLAAQRSRAADWLGVSSVEEGLALREAGVRLPVLVLGSLYPFESFLAAAAYRLTPTVASLEGARRLVSAARRLRRKLGCHLKVETGMGRIGVSPAAAVGVAEYLAGEANVRLEGIYTHFSCAEDDEAFTREQMSLFRKAMEGVARFSARPPLRHAANSAAALKHAWTRLDMVRPGLALYGLYKFFEPVLSLKSRVVFLKTVPRGTPVSYGATFLTRRLSRIATLPIGYADGVPRSLSNRGAVIVQGRRCPIVGRVTMDMLMADVTDAPGVAVGDEAVLIGAQGRERITAGEIAGLVGTIPYEVTTALSGRVPRVCRPPLEASR